MTEEKKNDKTTEQNPKVISFINMKGGVGKTTLTINVGYTLFRLGYKVLIVDIDPQFNATQALMTKFFSIERYRQLRDEGKTISSLLLINNGGNIVSGNKTPSITIDDVILNLESSNNAKFDLIPGDLSLTGFESSSRGSEKLLKHNLKLISPNSYDYILIDTPATYSIYTQASLIASKYYFTPISPDTFSALGYSLLQKALSNDLLMEDNHLINAGIIFTMYNENRRKRTSIAKDLKNNNTLENPLLENENIRSGNLQTFLYDMVGTKDNILDLTKEIITKVK